MRLLLLRHGQTTAGPHRYLGGRGDGPGLDETGRAQAAAAAAALRGLSLDGAIVSPLRRARETAAIAVPHNLPVALDPRLAEMDFGVLDGLTWAEVEATHPTVAARWREEGRPRPPGGEDPDAVGARVAAAALDACEAHPGAADLVLVTHGGPLRLIAGLARGLEPTECWRVPAPPGGICAVELSPPARRRLEAAATGGTRR